MSDQANGRAPQWPPASAQFRLDTASLARGALVDRAEGLPAAVDTLAGLYVSGARKLPADVPVDFVPSRWVRQVFDDDGRPDRYGWEMCVLSELRNALRGANVWVENARRYQDPARYLIDDLQWQRLRQDQSLVIRERTMVWVATVGRRVASVLATTECCHSHAAP